MLESQLIEVVTLLALSVCILAVFKRLHLSPVLGYMAVGIIIGNHGLGLIRDVDGTKNFAEYGVVFLLFIIGLDLTFDRLKEMRLHVFGFGTLQVFLCAVILGEIVYLITGALRMSFVIGFILSLSSTAVVMQVLGDRGETGTQHGRLSLANLILQDLAFVPLLIMIPLIAKGEGNFLYSVGAAMTRAAIALVLIVIVGKKFLGPIYHMIASLKSQELFLATTLVILLGAAWVTHHYGLSLALGAFVAGLLIAETEYRTQVETDLKPFKGLLMGLFFISVGMTIDLDILKENAFIILTLTSTLIVSKSFVIYSLARAFGFKRSCSVKTGMMLSQASEFAFVLLALALSHGILSEALSQIFVASIALSMVMTPFLAMLADAICRRIDIKNPIHYDVGDIEKEVSDLRNHVIVVGFDNVGKTTCDLLAYKEIKYVVLDDDPRSIHFGRKNRYPVFFGKPDVIANLENLGLERARLVAIMLHDIKQTSDLAKAIRAKYPNIYIVVRARSKLQANKLKSLKVNFSIAESFESSLMIGNFILSSLGISDSELEEAIDTFREREHPESQIRGTSIKVKEDLSVI